MTIAPLAHGSNLPLVRCVPYLSCPIAMVRYCVPLCLQLTTMTTSTTIFVRLHMILTSQAAHFCAGMNSHQFWICRTCKSITPLFALLGLEQFWLSSWLEDMLLWTDSKQWDFPKDELNGDKLKVRSLAPLWQLWSFFIWDKIIENVVLLFALPTNQDQRGAGQMKSPNLA